MKPKIYIETTIPSYLTAWPIRDLVRAAHQQLTREWWDHRRPDFDLFVSEAVILEAGSGDQVAAAARLEVLKGIPILVGNSAALALSEELVREVPLPQRALVDAAHIAIAVVGGMDFLLTWNCRHIANASLRTRIEGVCHSLGYSTTIICTPTELMKDSNDGR